MKRRKVNFINALITAALCMILLIGGVFGCFGFDCEFTSSNDGYAFFFNDSETGMFVGDDKTYTAEDFSFEPSAPRNFSFKLTASDENVLVIVGKRVFARTSGVTVLTATDAAGYTAECTVEVTKEIETFELSAAHRSLPAGDIRAIDIYAVINGGRVSPNRFSLEWTVDGRTVEGYKGGSFALGDKEVGWHTVSARVANRDGDVFESEIKVNRYERRDAMPVLECTDGNLIQIEGAPSPVEFKIKYEGEPSPYDLAEWFVNGKKVKRDNAEYHGEIFEFTPGNVGQYVISAAVNGQVLTDSFTVTLPGSSVPSGVKVDYDTFYPAVSVSWNTAAADESFTVRVTKTSDRTVKEYPATGGNVIIDGGKINLSGSDYVFAVKSDGNGSYLEPSAYSDPVTVAKLPAKAEEFLKSSWFGGNKYISSDDEFFAFYDYMMLYRNQPVVRSTYSKDTVYLGYKPNVTLSRLSEIAFNRAGYTGSYSIDVKRDKNDNNIVSLEFTFNTVSTPSKQNSGGEVSTKQLNGIAPHVSETGRAADSALYADNEALPAAKAETTDQLYRILEMGYRPDFSGSADSRAKTAYDYAKKVLNRILDDNMSDADKAHAIYDWIMWRVLYNTRASSVNEISEAVKYKAFYIESVLTDSEYFAVCDGMSKAYSLMCNLEGIQCVRVTGSAYSGGTEGGHAWNKVKVDGQWYIVDCTWGDFQVQLKSKTLFTESTDSYEIASHQYFLKTDSEMSATHTEDEDTDYPATASVPYNYFNESRLGNSDFTFYVTDGTDLTAYSNALVEYIGSKFDSKGQQTVTTFNGDTKSDYVAAEIRVAENALSSVKASLIDRSRGPLVAALSRARLKYNIYSVDSYIIVIASKNVNLV